MSANASFVHGYEPSEGWPQDGQQFDYHGSLAASPHFSNTSGSWTPPLMDMMDEIQIYPEYPLNDIPSMTDARSFLLHPTLPIRQIDSFHNTDSSLHRSVSDPASSRRAAEMRSRTSAGTPASVGRTKQRSESPSLPIGVILLDETTRTTSLSCHFEQCSGRTFSRLPELKRHYSEQHALYKPEYWCCVSDCPRSEQRGEKPFRRVDKCAEHERKQHCRM